MRHDSRSDELAEALRERIQCGSLPIGAKLPSEQAIALDFSVSRTVVREAMARLKSDGLLQTRKGAAARVCAPPEPALAVARSIDGLLGFLEVRRSVEAGMAALAAERRTDAQCREIERALHAIDRSTAAGGNGVEEDLAFHLAIGAATANAYWNQFVRLFAAPMRLAIGVTRANERRRLDFAAAVAAEHRRIFQAIEQRSPDEARDAVHRHLSNAADRVIHADRDFWRNEGGDLAEVWGRRALRRPIAG